MTRKKKHELALHTNAALFETDRVGARVAMEAERLRHQGTRHCIAAGCNEVVPCKRHGEPAGDHAVGTYFWPTTKGA